MSQQQRDRTVVLTVVRPVDGEFFRSGLDVRRITGLRVTFQIEKTLEREPNTCSISVFNLAEETRKQLTTRPLLVALDAGYQGRNARLFTGDLHYGQSMKEGGTWETILQVADGARAFKRARVSLSYRTGVTARTAAADVAESMGLTLKVSPTVEHALRTHQFIAGLALNGFSRDQLSTVLTPLGLTWSVQDGSLVVLGGDEARINVPPIQVRAPGMIGSPEFSVPEKEGERPILTVTSLLEPAATPGGLIQVNARDVNGRFRTSRVSHDGDTHGEPWHTTWEAKSSQVTAVPPLSTGVRALISQALSGVNTAEPGQVLTYDETTGRATVQPLIKEPREDGAVSKPPINEVPIIQPRGIRYPVDPGDTVLLIYCSGSLDRWMDSGREVDPADPRRHHLSDAVAIVGLDHYLDVPDVVIEFTRDGQILAGGSNQLATKADIDALASWVDSHTHPHGDPTTGPATGSPPGASGTDVLKGS